MWRRELPARRGISPCGCARGACEKRAMKPFEYDNNEHPRKQTCARVRVITPLFLFQEDPRTQVSQDCEEAKTPIQLTECTRTTKHDREKRGIPRLRSGFRDLAWCALGGVLSWLTCAAAIHRRARRRASPPFATRRKCHSLRHPDCWEATRASGGDRTRARNCP